MKRIRYCVATSLDGYIAGANGKSDWIIMDPEIDFKELMHGFDTALMGRRSFEVYGGAVPGMKTVVASRSLDNRTIRALQLSVMGWKEQYPICVLKLAGISGSLAVVCCFVVFSMLNW